MPFELINYFVVWEIKNVYGLKKIQTYMLLYNSVFLSLHASWIHSLWRTAVARASEVTAAAHPDGNKWKREQTPSPYKRMKNMNRLQMIIKSIRGTNPPWGHLPTTPGPVVHVDP